MPASSDRPRIPSPEDMQRDSERRKSQGELASSSEISDLKVRVLEMLTSPHVDFENFVGALGSLIDQTREEELDVVLVELKNVHKKIGGGGLLRRDVIDRMMNLPTLSTVFLFGSFLYVVHAAVNKDAEGVKWGMTGMAVSVWTALISILRAYAYRHTASKEDVKKRREVIKELIGLFEAKKLKRQSSGTPGGRSSDANLKRIESPKEKPFSM